MTWLYWAIGYATAYSIGFLIGAGLYRDAFLAALWPYALLCVAVPWARRRRLNKALREMGQLPRAKVRR